ncbi:MAG: hypothetical protein IK115_13220 [Lachnospiraceae bacterium]|nr:hypothetical protein [Lachnospiraceae bacterium]
MTKQYVQALLTGLKEKQRVLCTLQEKTDQQTCLLQTEGMDWDAFDALVDEKDALIDELDKLDDGFTVTFERIREELQEKKAEYKAQIAAMQEMIRTVTEQSTALQAAEYRNHELVKQKIAGERRSIRQQKTGSKAAANYYAAMNRLNFIDPQLMDKKK